MDLQDSVAAQIDAKAKEADEQAAAALAKAAGEERIYYHEGNQIMADPPAEYYGKFFRTQLGLMTEEHFAATVGIKVETLAIWRQRGQGPRFTKLGKNVFFHIRDVQQWVNECSRAPVATSKEAAAD